MRTIKKHLLLFHVRAFFVRILAENTLLRVLRGEVSAVGEHSGKNGYPGTDRQTQVRFFEAEKSLCSYDQRST